MCGIAGIFNKNGKPVEDNELKNMIGAVIHRGPDHVGTWCENNIGLSNSRLAIIDLNTGNQPIFSPDNKQVLVCNGEILNYVELTKELKERGHKFSTSSDVEVLLHLYRENPDDFLSKVNGQFAFAIFDREKNSITLGRDRMGICPLFYKDDNDRFLFGSEIKTIFRANDVERDLDPYGIRQAIQFWSCVPPRTAFKDINSLPPGYMMIIKPDNTEIKQYWHQEFAKPEDISIEERKAKLKQVMEDGVERALRSDVPVGLYLSGGVDSSILASIIHRKAGAGFRTFSVGFEDENFDESGYQQTMIDKIGAKHTRLKVSYDSVAETFKNVVYHTETPLFRTAPTPLFMLSEAVRDAGYKVVLSGEGADEVFWGYDTYRELYIRLLWQNLPESKWRPSLLQKIFPYFEQYQNPRNFGFLKGFYKKTLNKTDDPFYALLPRWQTNATNIDLLSEEAQNISKPYGVLGEDILNVLHEGFRELDHFQRYQVTEKLTLLAGYLLSSQGDRMLMSHSVEGRFPFLDMEVVNYAASLPNHLKCKGLKDKYLLREAFRDELPEEIYSRSKFAYRSPDAKSFYKGEKTPDYVNDMMSAEYTKKVGIFDVEKVEKLHNKVSGSQSEKITTKDNMAVTLILSTHLLHDKFVNNRP